MRIFVDVDDTLRITNLAALDEDFPNERLIAALHALNGHTEIIVWSTMGEAYAHEAAEQCLNAYGVHYSRAIEKDMKLLRDGDIAVDDTPIEGWSARWLTPNEFIHYAHDRAANWAKSLVHAETGGGH